MRLRVYRALNEKVESVDEKGGQDLAFHLSCPEIKMVAGMYRILMKVEMMNRDLRVLCCM